MCFLAQNSFPRISFVSKERNSTEIPLEAILFAFREGENRRNDGYAPWEPDPPTLDWPSLENGPGQIWKSRIWLSRFDQILSFPFPGSHSALFAGERKAPSTPSFDAAPSSEVGRLCFGVAWFRCHRHLPPPPFARPHRGQSWWPNTLVRCVSFFFSF